MIKMIDRIIYYITIQYTLHMHILYLSLTNHKLLFFSLSEESYKVYCIIYTLTYFDLAI